MSRQRGVITRREQRSIRRTRRLLTYFGGHARLKRSRKQRAGIWNLGLERYHKLVWYTSAAFVRHEERRRWHNQFYQGRCITQLPGLGCGWHLLGTPRVPSQCPFTPEMRLEVSDGLDVGRGSIRMCGPHDEWAEDVMGDGNVEATILLPVAHIGTSRLIRAKNLPPWQRRVWRCKAFFFFWEYP